jgi:hypothetical protein
MLVRVGPHRYRLKSVMPLEAGSPTFPYESVEIELRTWREWRTAHPDTSVYLGGGREVAEQGGSL